MQKIRVLSKSLLLNPTPDAPTTVILGGKTGYTDNARATYLIAVGDAEAVDDEPEPTPAPSPAPEPSETPADGDADPDGEGTDTGGLA